MFEKNNIIEFLYPKDQKKILEDVFPIPTKLNLPDWFKKLKFNMQNKTIRGCIPFMDTLTAGYILKMPQDFYVKHNFVNDKQERDSIYRFSYQDFSNFIWQKVNLNTINPQVHNPKQLGEKCPFHNKNKNLSYYKILNPFLIKTPPGYSCLFTPPLNNRDDRFEIISGIVDTDKFPNYINFPIIINGDKYPELETTIARGLPYVQVIPFKRENWKMEIKPMSENHNNLFLLGTKKIMHTYKTFFWSKKKWN